jgi:hypothetical protein
MSWEEGTDFPPLYPIRGILTARPPLYNARPIQSKWMSRSFASFLRCNMLKVGGSTATCQRILSPQHLELNLR